jgi:hypothetical protein
MGEPDPGNGVLRQEVSACDCAYISGHNSTHAPSKRTKRIMHAGWSVSMEIQGQGSRIGSADDEDT